MSTHQRIAPAVKMLVGTRFVEEISTASERGPGGK
jgi:hypothetical protein